MRRLWKGHVGRVLCLALLFISQSSPGWADGLIRDGVGAISSGRGGTNIAHSDNGAVLLDNPAGIMNLRDTQSLFEVGADMVITDLDYSDPFDQGVNGKFRPFTSPHLAWFRTSDDGQWGVGIGVFAPAGFTAEYSMFNPILGQRDYRSLGALVKVTPSLAYKATDRLSLGASFGVGVSHAELDGPFFLQTGPLAGTPTQLQLEVDGATPIYSFGMQYELTNQTTIGLAYQSESRFTLDGEANVIIPGMFPLVSNFDAELDLCWPRSLGLGVTHRVNRQHRVSADVIWYDWSDAFDQMDLRFQDPSNPIVAGLVGPELRDTLAMNWRDSVSVRLGYEYFVDNGDVWRLGYVYHRSPVPDSTLNPYLDGMLTHTFSAGYGTHWKDWGVNFAYQYYYGPERSVGTSDLVGGDFDNSDFQAQAHWLMLSLQRKY